MILHDADEVTNEDRLGDVVAAALSSDTAIVGVVDHDDDALAQPRRWSSGTLSSTPVSRSRVISPAFI